MSQGIGLSELITKVKEDLASTNKESPAFLVDKVELDLQVAISKEVGVEGQAKAKADLKINVLSFDLFKVGEAEATGTATGSLKKENVHTIKVTLSPAILNQQLMDYLKQSDPETLKKVEESWKRIGLQGTEEGIES
jgi:hypothetical protein